MRYFFVFLFLFLYLTVYTLIHSTTVALLYLHEHTYIHTRTYEASYILIYSTMYLRQVYDYDRINYLHIHIHTVYKLTALMEYQQKMGGGFLIYKWE